MYLCTRPYQAILSKLHETCSTRTTGTSTTRRVLQLRNLYGLPNRLDHEKRALRHDKEVNLLDLHNRDMSHRVQQLGNAYGPTNRLDHREQPLRRDGEMNLHDLHNRDVDHRVQELQPWNHRGLLNSKTMEICLCTMKEMSTTLKNCNRGNSAVFLQCERKSLRSLTHEQESAVEPSIALKYEGQKRVNFSKSLRKLT